VEQAVYENGSLSFEVDLRVYRVSAVKKAAYRLAARCTVAIGSPDGDRLPLRLLLRSNEQEAASRESLRLFFEELMDAELREQIADETAPMRALILANAFSRTDLVGRS
jgi:His-Xaa-Ser system protein HxsD